jgi:hypothetical protein
MSVDGGIHAIRGHNNVRSVLQNAKKKKKKKKVGPAIQNIRCGMLTYGIVFLHDNVSLHTHTAACTLALLEHFNWELFDYPPYNLVLTPSSYHFFTYLKNWMGSQCFNNNELMEGVNTWLSSQAADFFDISKPKLISRYDKCLNSSSNYVEK